MSEEPRGAFEGFFSALTQSLIRWRWLAILLLIALTAVFFLQARQFTINSNNDIWFVKGDRTLLLSDKFKALFNNDDFVYILFESEDFFRAEAIEKIRHLAAELEAEVPYLLDITWLGNVEYIEGKQDEIDIYELLEETPQTAEAMRQVRFKALAEPTYVNDLISPDGKVAGLLLEMDDYPVDPDGAVDPRKDVPPVVRAVLARPEYAALELHAVGGPIMDYDLDVLTAQEGGNFFALCLLVQMIILFWIGRGPRGVLVPMLVVAGSVLWTLGGIVLYGFTLNLFAIMVPVLLICVGIGDSMHIIAEFDDQYVRGASRSDALKRAMSRVGWPCLLTSLTTAAGFLSFASARLAPYREMGVYTATGVVIAMGLSYLLVPVIYSFGRPFARGAVPDSAPSRNDIFDRWLAWTYGVVTQRTWLVVGVFSLLTIASIVGYTRLRVESNFIEMFSEDVPIRQDYDYVDATMGGTMSLEFMIDAGRSNGVTDPEFLRRLEALDRYANADPLVTKTTSVLDILKKMRKAFNENRPEHYRIPESREEASQFLLLYEMSGGEDKGKLVTFNQDVARFTARTRSLDSMDARHLVNALEEYSSQEFGSLATVEFTGMLSWIRAMVDLISQGQRRSFITAFFVISLIMMVVLRSVWLGMISMIPNLFPVLISLGTMGWLGIYMDLAMMTFAAVIIGVAVDDTIHFFVRFRREFGLVGNYNDALRRTLSTVGRPITFTTITLSIGFAVLGFSDVGGIVHFGLLAGFAFSWALLADFFFAPALMLLLRPLGPERI